VDDRRACPVCCGRMVRVGRGAGFIWWCDDCQTKLTEQEYWERVAERGEDA
jgi:ribosomal protein L37AE/L43A